MSSVGFLGSGCLFLDRFDSSGNKTGFQEVGNAIKFAIKPDAEKVERLSKRCDSFGQVRATTFKPKPTTLSITMDEFDRVTLAAALFGTDAVVDNAAGNVTDESITGYIGRVSFLAHRNVTSVVVTDSTGGTTYTVDTDYTVNADTGAITVIDGGAITDGQALLVDYSHGAEKYLRINGSTESIVNCAVRLNGKNQESGKPCIVNVLKAVFMPSGEVDFLADDNAEIQLEATLVTPDGATAPYTVDYYDGV